MQSSSRRTLLQALAVSLLIHGALVLSPLRPFAEALDLPALTISAVISRARRSQTDAPHVPAAPVAAMPAPVARAAPAAPAPRRDIERAKILARPSAEASTPVTAPAATNDTVSPAPAGSSSPSAPSSPAASAGPPAAASASATGEAISADDLRQYSVSLGLAARRFKRYPALARERGWEGRAEIELVFTARSSLPELALARSSGRTVLDEQALEMMSQAARVAAVPEGLRGRSFRLLKPVEFSLESDR